MIVVKKMYGWDDVLAAALGAHGLSPDWESEWRILDEVGANTKPPTNQRRIDVVLVTSDSPQVWVVVGGKTSASEGFVLLKSASVRAEAMGGTDELLTAVCVVMAEMGFRLEISDA